VAASARIRVFMEEIIGAAGAHALSWIKPAPDLRSTVVTYSFHRAKA
jgi:hypothetical protein